MNGSPQRGELKPHMIIVVEKRTTSITKEKHFLILEIRPELKDELIILLKNMSVVGQGLFTPIIQPIIRGIFESRAPKLLKDFTKQGGFKKKISVDEKFHEETLELVLLNNHNHSKETTINMGARKDIHGTLNCLPCQNVQDTSTFGCQHKSNWNSPCTHWRGSSMGKKRNQTHTSSRDRRQKKNYNNCIIFNKWVNVTFASCVLNHKSNASTHE